MVSIPLISNLQFTKRFSPMYCLGLKVGSSHSGLRNDATESYLNCSKEYTLGDTGDKIK